MKVAGIIAEYNPFHNGHAWHLAQTRALSGADRCVAVLSGDMVQRGEPAFLDQSVRTEMALRGGADVVVQLPYPLCCAGAEDFALGGVALLQALGCVDVLSFGAEVPEGQTPDALLEQMERTAALLEEEPEAFQAALRDGLRQGLPFPAARQQALHTVAPQLLTQEADAPNRSLGIEYLRALLRLSSPIRPLLIPRTGAGHDMRSEGAVVPGQIASASEIRSRVRAGEDVLPLLPEEVRTVFQNALEERGSVTADDLFPALLSRLILLRNADLTAFYDVSPAIEARIKKSLTHAVSTDRLVKEIKTRDLTEARVRRVLMHLLLDMRASDVQAIKAQMPPYVRILGFRRSAAPLLSTIWETCRVPLVMSPADALNDPQALSGTARTMLQKDLAVSELYRSMQEQKTGRPLQEWLRRPLVMID